MIMQISHLGHAAVLLQTDDARILVDPGNVNAGWHDLTDLDAVFVTHSHPDHLDPAAIGALLAANPDAKVYGEPSIAAAGVSGVDGLTGLDPGSAVTVGGLTVAAVGGTHAEIHRDIPRIGNVGLVFSAAGEPTFFHPGDAYDTAPGGVDVLAMPAYGPWAALKETVDFVRAVGAPHGFPIHDGLLAEPGFQLVVARINDMTGTALQDLRSGTATSF